jgi:hypothetical protein
MRANRNGRAMAVCRRARKQAHKARKRARRFLAMVLHRRRHQIDLFAQGWKARLLDWKHVRRGRSQSRPAARSDRNGQSQTIRFSHPATFSTVRQELKRFQRKGLGYSKHLETHKLAVALHFGVYNFVRQHHTLGTTPAVAAGIEEKPWSLEQVVEMAETYWLKKRQR